MQIKRASTDKLREIFARYATQQINGELFMTSEEFVRGFLGQSYNEESVKLLAGIADTSKDGLISFAEFQAFEGLLCTPDALYKTAFQLFDRNGNGSVTYTLLWQGPPADDQLCRVFPVFTRLSRGVRAGGVPHEGHLRVRVHLGARLSGHYGEREAAPADGGGQG